MRSTVQSKNTICGAPAVAGRDAPKDDVHDAQESPVTAASPALEAIPLDAFQAGAPEAEDGFPSDADSWEDIDEAELGDSEGGAQLTRSASEAPSTQAGPSVLTIHLDPGSRRKEGSGQKRRSFTKADREAARLVHRSHLLCLLGRGLLYDQAADDALLQAAAVSLVPPDLATQLAAEFEATSLVDNALNTLNSVLEWYRAEFKLAKVLKPTGSSNDIEAALAAAKGVVAVTERLLEVVHQRQGSSEELAAVFAAVLRAQGCITRTIRLFEPSALSPAQAEKQEDNAIRAFMRRPTRREQKRSDAIDLAASGQDVVVAGGGSQGGDGASLQVIKEQVAQQLGLADSSAIEVTVGNGRAGPSIALKPSKGKQKGGKRKAAAGNLDETGVKSAKAVEGNGSRKAGSAETVRDRELDTVDTVVQLKDVKEAAQMVKPGGSSGTDGKANGGRKRKCDEELEQQLALAMAATAFPQNRHPSNGAASQPDSSDADGAPNKMKAVKQLAKRRGGARGAAFGPHQADIGRYWVEVYCGTAETGRWVHVDPVAGWVDRAGDVEGLVPRGTALAYVVAFAGGGAKDVTRRYTSSFVAAEQQREGEWWDATLRPFRSKEVAAMHAAARGSSAPIAVPPGSPPAGAQPAFGRRDVSHNKQVKGKDAVHSMASKREDLELEAWAAAERRSLPTTIEGFRSHDTFVLARHIGKYQVLRPGSKTLGTHRGEAYYHRDSLGEVHTAERWKRLGREVLPEELSRPAKMIKKRGAPGDVGGLTQKRGRRGKLEVIADAEAAADAELGLNEGAEDDDRGDGIDPAMTSAFFGEWQTREWAPPAASGGKVPKNDRGNVEVPPLAAVLPAGTVHIQLPQVAGACRRLGIDYAPALLGFDIRGGRSVPNIDGVVVCVEHEAAVRAACAEDMRQRAERAKQKRLAAGEEAWHQLLRALLTRVRLQMSYGEDGGGQEMSAQQEAAALLVHGGGVEGHGSGAAPPATRSAGEPDAQRAAEGVDVDVEEI